MHLTVGLDGNDAVEESRAKICPGRRIGGYLAVGLPDTVIRKIPRISLTSMTGHRELPISENLSNHIETVDSLNYFHSS